MSHLHIFHKVLGGMRFNRCSIDYVISLHRLLLQTAPNIHKTAAQSFAFVFLTIFWEILLKFAKGWKFNKLLFST